MRRDSRSGTPQQIAAENTRDPEWVKEQLLDLAIHLEHKPRVSRLRTAEAIRRIAAGYEWRIGAWP